MTIRARYGHVRTSNGEPGFFMSRPGECTRDVRLHRVAPFAIVAVRVACKLANMLVGMAVGAVLKRHLEYRVPSFRDVALNALQSGMSACQWVLCCGRVFLQTKR